MRRNIRRHADRDTRGAVDEQVREAAGEHARLLARLVEVGVPIDGILFEVAEHLVGNLGEARLRVTVSRGRVAVHGAEVAVPIHEHIAHGEILRQTDEGVINGRVAVRMVTTQDVADAGRGLLKRLVRGQIILIHCIQNAPVHGLQAVAHVGQGAPDNHGHGVFHIAGFHLMYKLAGHDRLIREHNILGLVILLMCQGVSSLI